MSSGTEHLSQWARLERYHRERSPADRERLVEEFMPLARHLARRYHAGGEREDLEQVAALALVKAVDRFDPARGAAFTTFAIPTIVGEIKRYFRDLGWSVRVPRELQELAARVERETERMTGRLGRVPTSAEVAEACGASVERVVEARGTATAHFADSLDVPAGPRADDDPLLARLAEEEAGYSRVEIRADLDVLLAGLPERERRTLKLRFMDGLTQREIAACMGLSQMQVSRILRRVLADLSERSQGARATLP